MLKGGGLAGRMGLWVALTLSALAQGAQAASEIHLLSLVDPSAYSQREPGFHGALHRSRGEILGLVERSRSSHDVWVSGGTRESTRCIGNLPFEVTAESLSVGEWQGDIMLLARRTIYVARRDGQGGIRQLLPEPVPGVTPPEPFRIRDFVTFGDGLYVNHDGFADGLYLYQEATPQVQQLRFEGWSAGTGELMRWGEGFLHFWVEPDYEDACGLFLCDGTTYHHGLIFKFSTSNTPWNLYPRYTAELDGLLFFWRAYGDWGLRLWRTDGTEAGTFSPVPVLGGRPAPYSEPKRFQNHVWFAANDYALGRTLWRTDGTREGTELVVDVVPGEEPPLPDDAMDGGAVMLTGGIVHGNRMFFRSRTADRGYEVYMTDGTAEGTIKLTANAPQPDTQTTIEETPVGVREPNGVFAAIGNRVYFVHRLFDKRTSLWETDGTAEGTHAIDYERFAEVRGLLSVFENQGELYTVGCTVTPPSLLYRTTFDTPTDGGASLFHVAEVKPDTGRFSGGEHIILSGVFPVDEAIMSLGEAEARFAVYFGQREGRVRARFTHTGNGYVNPDYIHVVAPRAPGDQPGTWDLEVHELDTEGSTLRRTWPMGYTYRDPEEGEDEIEREPLPAEYHDADTNQNHRIDTGELLAVIQLHHTGAYHCGGDGVLLPGPGDTACTPHHSDYYRPSDYHVGLPELLRLIQLANTGAYHPCTEGEDYFCPGAAP